MDYEMGMDMNRLEPNDPNNENCFETNVSILKHVSEHPYLWDCRHVQFKNRVLKEKIWQDIANDVSERHSVSIDFAEARRRWEIIKGGYYRSRKLNRHKPYVYANHLGFLIEKLDNEQVPNNLLDFEDSPPPPKSSRNSCCCLPHCRTPSGDGVSLHSFPTDFVLKQVWMHILKIDKEVAKSAAVCSKHFSEKSFRPSKLEQPTKKLLHKNAFPDQNLPDGGSGTNPQETYNEWIDFQDYQYNNSDNTDVDPFDGTLQGLHDFQDGSMEGSQETSQAADNNFNEEQTSGTDNDQVPPYHLQEVDESDINVIIIKTVKKHRCLWDEKHKNYRDPIVRRRAWKRVTTDVKLQTDTEDLNVDVRRRFEVLKSNYLRRFKRNADGSLTQYKPYTYSRCMHFLIKREEMEEKEPKVEVEEDEEDDIALSMMQPACELRETESDGNNEDATVDDVTTIKEKALISSLPKLLPKPSNGAPSSSLQKPPPNKAPTSAPGITPPNRKKIRRCIACPNTSRITKDVSYFRVPPDNELAVKWLKNVKRTDLLPYIGQPGCLSNFVCSEHFLDSAMYWKNRNGRSPGGKRLRRRAIPYAISSYQPVHFMDMVEEMNENIANNTTNTSNNGGRTNDDIEEDDDNDVFDDGISNFLSTQMDVGNEEVNLNYAENGNSNLNQNNKNNANRNTNGYGRTNNYNENSNGNDYSNSNEYENNGYDDSLFDNNISTHGFDGSEQNDSNANNGNDDFLNDFFDDDDFNIEDDESQTSFFHDSVTLKDLEMELERLSKYDGPFDKGSDFNLDGFEELDETEKRMYRASYPKLELICERRVHCTSCNSHIGTAPINEAIVRMHPVLRVTQCKKCHTFYNSGEFERGDDGSELYCRWCGQGGEVYCCSKCPYVFCRRCIVQNLSKSCVIDIANNENWNCFACSPKIMTYLRAQHWALVNFMEKQKRDIAKKTLTEDEINELMSKDLSLCCKGTRSKRPLNPNQGAANVPARAQKRRSTATPDRTEPPPKAKILPKLLNPSLPDKGNSAKKGGKSDMVVCTPDILGMIEENGSSRNSGGSPQQTNPPPLIQTGTSTPFNSMETPPLRPIQRREVTIRRHVLNQNPTTGVNVLNSIPIQPVGNPVYHTINGFRIDLNSASQQETFRLPNGKLIQVKKQTPGTQPTVTQMPQTRGLVPIHNVQLPPRFNINLRAPTNAMPQLRQISLTTPLTTTINATTFAQQQQQQQTTITPTQPPPLIIRNTHPNNPVGKARNQFEQRVENSMEVCQHIIGKINTLVNSSSYKNVKNLRDLKDLNLHLSYLLTYAMSRFKTLQEKCTEDMQKMGFSELTVPTASTNSDDDDIEIVEPQTTLIDLDSDNENEASGNQKNKSESIVNSNGNGNDENMSKDESENEYSKSIDETVTLVEVTDLEDSVQNEENQNGTNHKPEEESEKTTECTEKNESDTVEKENNPNDDIEDKENKSSDEINEENKESEEKQEENEQIDEPLKELEEKQEENEKIDETLEDVEMKEQEDNQIEKKDEEKIDDEKNEISENQEKEENEEKLENKKIEVDEEEEETQISDDNSKDSNKNSNPIDDIERACEESIQEIINQSEEVLERETASQSSETSENSNSQIKDDEKIHQDVENDEKSELDCESIFKEFLELHQKDIPNDKFDENLIKMEISKEIETNSNSKVNILENVFKIFKETNG